MANMDNPPAFPNHPAIQIDGHPDARIGMTMRDWFAGQSISAVMAKITGAGTVNEVATLVAETAYAIADAMLARRDQSKETE